MDLYGRDDTIDALWLQQEVALACAEGWRPSRPISRGGQAPTLEASFQVPRSQPPGKLDISKIPWDLERFTYHREIQQLLEQNMLEKPSASEPAAEPSALTDGPQEAFGLPQAAEARDEEADMVEAAAIARKANNEPSDESDIESPHEEDEASLTEDKPDSEVWFVQNGPWGKVHLAKPDTTEPKAACGAKLCLVALWVKSFDHNLRCKRKACCQ